MNSRGLTVLLVLALVAFVASSFFYTVKEYERGVLLKFGEIVESDLKPGLSFKIPIFNEPRLFDGRVLSLDMRPEEYLTKEKKRLIVDSFVMWQIDNVGKYYTATGGGLESQAQRLLAPRINEGLRNKFGERSVYEVVSGQREELMVELTEEVNKKTQAEFGVKILDVRVRRIELPPSVSGSVYQRMRAEREREAREHRSRGKEKAEGIRAEADRERIEILAKAYKESEETRGAGDAISASTYAKAYNKDQEFYEFFRKLQAYREVFADGQDIMVVEPEGDFFDKLKVEK